MNYRGFSLIVALALFATVSFAQVPGQLPEVPVENVNLPIEPVLQHIPSDCLGFVIVNDITATVDNIGSFASNFSPDMNGEVLMEQMLWNFDLGDGFNPDGGFAIVMLNPENYDFDLMKVIKEAMDGPDYSNYGGETYNEDGDVIVEADFEDEADVDDVEEAVTDDDSSATVPAVFFIPGSSFAEVFPTFGGEMVADGDVTKIMPEYEYGTVMYTANQGSYLLVSPNKKAVQDVRNALGFVEMELTDNQAKVIKDADGAFFVNMQVCAPMVSEMMTGFLEMIAEEMPEEDSPISMEDIEGVMGLYTDLLEQTDSILGAYSVDDTGIRAQVSALLVADSDYGKLLAQMPASDGVLLDCLPNNNYVFAMGTVVNQPESMKQMYMDNFDIAMKVAFYLSEDTLTKYRELTEAKYGTLSEIQFAAGGAPEGNLFSIVVVAECEDAAAQMGDLDDAIGLIQAVVDDFVAYLAEEDPDTFGAMVGEGEPLVEFVVEETALSLKGVPLSKVTVSSAALEAMMKEEGASMDVINENFTTVWIAPVDATHVALVYGGGTDTMEQVIDAVTGEGLSIADDEGVQTVLAELPENPQAVMVFSMGNLGTVVGDLETKFAAGDDSPSDFPMIFMEDTKPFAMTVHADGPEATASFFLSADIFVDMQGAFEKYSAAQEQYYQQQRNGGGGNGGGNNDIGEPVTPDDEDF